MSKKKSNFYAVRKGRKVGIFRTWEACRNSVEGYSGCEYKGFTEIGDAEEYMNGIKLPDSNYEEEVRIEENPLFFAVRKGNTVGIFKTLDECWKAIDGYAGAEAKQFKTKNEAERYLAAVAKVDKEGSHSTEELEMEEAYYMSLINETDGSEYDIPFE